MHDVSNEAGENIELGLENACEAIFIERNQSPVAINVPESQNETRKRKRGKEKSYYIVKHFISVEEFDSYWVKESLNTKYNLANHHKMQMLEYKLYRCKYYRKKGYGQCGHSMKLVFDSKSQNIQLQSSNTEHIHEKVGQVSESTSTYVWLNNSNALAILQEGVKHKDNPTELMMDVDRKCYEKCPDKKNFWPLFKADRHW